MPLHQFGYHLLPSHKNAIPLRLPLLPFLGGGAQRVCYEQVKLKLWFVTQNGNLFLKILVNFVVLTQITGEGLSCSTARAGKEIKESDKLSSADARLAQLARGLGS